MIVKHLPDGSVAVKVGDSMTRIEDGDDVCLVPASSKEATDCRAKLLARLESDTDFVRSAKLAGYPFGSIDKPMDVEAASTDLLYEELRKDIALAFEDTEEGKEAALRVKAHMDKVQVGEATWPSDENEDQVRALLESWEL